MEEVRRAEEELVQELLRLAVVAEQAGGPAQEAVPFWEAQQQPLPPVPLPPPLPPLPQPSPPPPRRLARSMECAVRPTSRFTLSSRKYSLLIRKRLRRCVWRRRKSTHLSPAATCASAKAARLRS